MSTSLSEARGAGRAIGGAVFPILLALSVSHFLNDMMQSLLPALYPMLKTSFGLSFAQVGLITLATQLTSSLLQPAVGFWNDRRPLPHALAIGMGATLIGLFLLAGAGSYALLMIAAALAGVGSAVFHPEASRVARLASGGRHGLAQSLFQMGGNVGSTLGPILAVFIVIPHGQGSVAWFSLAALAAMAILFVVGNWHRREQAALPRLRPRPAASGERPGLSRRQIGWSIAILGALIFSKAFYTTSLTSYLTFYLIGRFHVSVPRAQFYLFAFLLAVAVGTLIGGPVGDRIGRKYVLWGSIVGVLPFTLALPYADLYWTGILVVAIGVTLASASSAIIVYALELLPGRIGTVAGLFFGLSFGMAGIGAAALGRLADATSIDFVYRLCAFLPAIGLVTALLPDLGRPPPALSAEAVGR